MLINCKNRLTLRTAESACASSLEPFRANRAAENLREDAFCNRSTLLEEIDSIIQRIFDIEELRESEELENFINLRLNFKKNNVAALWFNQLEECGERTDTS